MFKRSSIFLASVGLAACGNSNNNGNNNGGADAPVAIDAVAADAPRPDATPGFEATHPAPPTVLSGGGNVLAAPKVVPVFFANDATAQATIEQFLTALAASSYWTTISQEYGVGSLTIAPTVVATETPPTTDDAIQSLVTAHAGGTGGWPANTANTIYAIFLPDGVTETFGGGTSCVDFGGYHDETQNSVVYAVMPRCASMTFPGLEDVTLATSHEFLEASTDPHPGSAPGFNQIDDEDAIWQLMPGAELGDMCEFARASFQPLVGSFFVQRTWSNASAAAGHDPCVPVLATPYVEAATNVPDISIDTGGGQTLVTRGIELAVGASKTIEVDLYSDAETSADWTVVAFDAASKFNMQPVELTFSFDKNTGHNGDKLMLTVTRMAAANPNLGVSEFVLESQVDGVTDGTWWTLVN